MTRFSNLDPLLHSQLRLAIIALLLDLESADFPFIKKETGATAGNLSIQVKKLEAAGYISVKKQFSDSYPQTTCSITQKGITAFENYVKSLQQYIAPAKKD